MIDKLKYNYTFSMPLAEEYFRNTAAEAAPDLCAIHTGEEDQKPTDIQFGNSYSTNGWDTASVCRVSDLNTSIANQKTYPLHIDYTLKEDEDTYKLSAGFKPWSMTAGGDGGNVNLKIDFDGDTENYFMMGDKKKRITYCSAEIQVHLNYFPQPEMIAKAGNYTLNPDTEASQVNPVSVISFESNLPELAVQPIAQAVFSAWINSRDTLQKINILFSTAQLSTYDRKDFAWLVPTYSSYAFADIGGDVGKCKFAVLCMLKGRTAPLVHQMPAVEFTNGNNCAFMLNREVFVEYQLLPALPLSFANSSASDFTLKKSDKITITAENLKLQEVQYNNVDYYPKLRKMTITVDEFCISCEVDFNTEISAGIVAHTFVRTQNKVQLGKNAKGEAIMEYVPDGAPVTRNETKVAAWVIVTEIIAESIVAVAGACIFKVVSTIIKRVVVCIVVVIICAAISVVIHVIIERVISEGVQSVLPSIVPMTAAATKSVNWPFVKSGGEFKVQKIELNGTLYFEGRVG